MSDLLLSVRIEILLYECLEIHEEVILDKCHGLFIVLDNHVGELSYDMYLLNALLVECVKILVIFFLILYVIVC